MSSGTPTPFSGIIITALLIVGLYISFAVIATDVSQRFTNVEIDNSSYTLIITQVGELENISKSASENFFSNQTRTNTLSATDRLLGSAYSAFLVLGALPNVFYNIVHTMSNTIIDFLGLPASLATLVDIAILMIIIGTIIYLAVGRR